MTVSPKRVLMALELVFGGIAAVLSLLVFWFALPHAEWRRYSSYAFLDAWLLLLAAVAFVAAAYWLRSAATQVALHVVAIAWALLLLYCLAASPIVLRRLCLLTFFMSAGVSTATVLAADALVLRNRRRALRFSGLAFAGAAMVATTVWLGASGCAEMTADILLMLDSRPYVAVALEAFELPVALGLTLGFVVGGFLLWRKLRSSGASTSVLDLFWPRCPQCRRRGLKSYPDKGIVLAAREGLRANPAWLWQKCRYCNARFKERHYGDGTLQPVSEQEWDESAAERW
jgi:hypothetical protein